MHEKKYPLVTDPSDPRFLALIALRIAQNRSRSGLYLIEGIRHLAKAVEHAAPLRSVFFDPSILTNSFGRKLIRRLIKSGIPGIRLSPQLYRRLTLASEPQGVGAIVRQRWVPLEELQTNRRSFWLGIESVDSPGNLGTVIRTAEAAGVDGVFVIGEDADPWDPAAVRSSMGSLFSQKLARCSVHEFAGWARFNHVAIVGSSPTGVLNYRAWRYHWPAVLLLGSEKRGLSERLVEVTDFMVRIPMRGRCDSINVAVAAGVLLFEMANQHRPT